MKNRQMSPLEMIGAGKARRAMNARLAYSLPNITGALAATVVVMMQDGEGDPRSGKVSFSTYAYIAWGEQFHQLAAEDQEQIAVGHLRESMEALRKQEATILAKIEEQRAKRDAAREVAEIAEGEERYAREVQAEPDPDRRHDELANGDREKGGES